MQGGFRTSSQGQRRTPTASIKPSGSGVALAAGQGYLCPRALARYYLRPLRPLRARRAECVRRGPSASTAPPCFRSTSPPSFSVPRLGEGVSERPVLLSRRSSFRRLRSARLRRSCSGSRSQSRARGRRLRLRNLSADCRGRCASIRSRRPVRRARRSRRRAPD
jgi:hypothetical protein